MKRSSFICGTMVLFLSFAQAGERTALAWPFGNDAATKAWMRGGQRHSELRLVDGIISGETVGTDPFLTSPGFSLEATAVQSLAFRAKIAIGGAGEAFWVPQSAKSWAQEWSARFDWIGDGAWHEYRVRLFWQEAKKVKSLRLDFPQAPEKNNAFEIADLRIVEDDAPLYKGEPVWKNLDGWKKTAEGLETPALAIDSGERFIAAIRVKTEQKGPCSLYWAGDASVGKHFQTFTVKPGTHTYDLDMLAAKGWRGKIMWLRLSPPEGAVVESFQLTDEFDGPADVCLDQVRMEDAFNRVGTPAEIWVQLSNVGGSEAKDVTVEILSMPDGLSVASPEGWNRVAAIPATKGGQCRFRLAAARPVSGTLKVAVKYGGAVQAQGECKVEFLPGLNLPKASYVPEPKPLKSDYQVGALYFPGWPKIESWARIWPVAPERKPILGWYDEANPEVVDWQIKWAAENGIQYFLVDWYWVKGQKHLDHWVNAFQKAKYRRYLKWAMMWANHTAPGTHSEEDQRNVTQYWLDHYFNTPEYYRINDMPVVMIWSSGNYDRDLGKGGCKRMLDLSRAMAKAAGYKGIWFIAMKWPEGNGSAATVQGYKDQGFDMTAIYHYMENGGKPVENKRFPFDQVVDTNAALWEELQKTGILPFLPGLSTGWDDRPWNNHLEIYGRTPEKFARICAEAKAFADKTGVKNLLLGPLNEWGEGSYAEPNSQYGFGMYEAVRDTFCKKPEGGWPLNYGPKDVGLGPYDLPMPVVEKEDFSTSWSFRDGKLHGWNINEGNKMAKFNEDGVTFKTTTRDPIFSRDLRPLATKKYTTLSVRMKVSANGGKGDLCQIFWSHGGMASEETSLHLPIIADGAFHDYVFKLTSNKTWKGHVTGLRFDPCSSPDVFVTIGSIQLQ